MSRPEIPDGDPPQHQGQRQGQGDVWSGFTPPGYEQGNAAPGPWPPHGAPNAPQPQPQPQKPQSGLPLEFLQTQPVPVPIRAPAPAPVPPAPFPPSPSHHKRPRSRGPWIALLIVVVLLCAGGGGTVAYASAQTNAVAQAAGRYCRALLADDYAAAYNTLTPGLQAGSPRGQFVADGKLHDQIDGRVTQCTASDAASGLLGSVSQIGSASRTLTVTIRRAIAYTGPIAVAKQGGDWKIASVAPSLQGTDLAPLKTGQALCAALVAQRYATAYALLSGAQQSQVSEQQFAAQFSDTFTGSPMSLAGCDLDLTTYFVSGATAKVNMRLTINNPQASSGLLTVALTMTRENGAWKIDDLRLAD